MAAMWNIAKKEREKTKKTYKWDLNPKRSHVLKTRVGREKKVESEKRGPWVGKEARPNVARQVQLLPKKMAALHASLTL